MFILHADHELNCSTATVRTISSANADVYTCISAGIGALFGRNHGGANESEILFLFFIPFISCIVGVLRMLDEIGTAEKIPEFLQKVKDKKAKLMGFGHRVYKNVKKKTFFSSNSSPPFTQKSTIQEPKLSAESLIKSFQSSEKSL